MARANCTDDSDDDLPDLDELISKHVKNLHALRAPSLNLSGAGYSRPLLSPRKIATGNLNIQKYSCSTDEKKTQATRSIDSSAISNAEFDQLKPLQACRNLRQKQPDEYSSSKSTLSAQKRIIPHRSAKAAVSYSMKNTSVLEGQESALEESMWCWGDDGQDISSARDILSRSPRKTRSKQYTSDSGQSDSDDDIFGFKDGPTKPLRMYQSPAKRVQKSSSKDHLPQAMNLSDKENDHSAILKFSPPQFARPYKTIVPERPATPPPSSPSKSKLVSPSKKKAHIPAPPHRPSIDTFWNVHAVNDWHDQYSPKKLLMSPKKKAILREEEPDSLPSSPRKSQSPTKRTRAEVEAKKGFESQKLHICEAFLAELDREVTGGKIFELSSLTGGVKFVWSKTLNSTAGRACWRRETIKERSLDGTTATTYRHHASIELAEKVIDNEERLVNVLAHEFCHLANFMISGIKDQPHGHQFKVWAAKTTKAFGHRGIRVTTKHSYQIDYKYIWTCSNQDCGREFGRHSKSIDPDKSSCGVCRGKLAQTKPVPRKQTGVTGYAAFVKEHFVTVKRDLGSESSHKEVMAALGKRYREQKGTILATKESSAAVADVDDMVKALEVVNISD